MLDPNYKYCPFDGHELVTKTVHTRENLVCSFCGRTQYFNQLLTASALIFKDNKFLVVRRAIEPFAGMLDFPGGFVEPTETAREAIVREVEEELHVKGKVVKLIEVLGPDPYPFEGVIRQNADALYQVEIGDEKLVPDDDVESIEWKSLSELSESDFAFPSHQQLILGLKAGTYTL